MLVTARRNRDELPEVLCALAALAEILHRGALAPPAPTVADAIEARLPERSTRIQDYGQSVEETKGLVMAWAAARRVAPVANPIRVFDDESGGARAERPFWDLLQEWEGGALAPWAHPQVPFDRLSGHLEYDDRRVDFVLSPPWLPKPLAWEIHGEFDVRDSNKDQVLRSLGFDTVNQFVGHDEATSLLDQLCSAPGEGARSGVADRLYWYLDATWVVAQIDLGLYWLLATGSWNSVRPEVVVSVPEEFEPLLSVTVKAFYDLVESLERIWKVEGRLLSQGLAVRSADDRSTHGQLHLRIDPAAAPYLDAADGPLDGELIARRILVPWDPDPPELIALPDHVRREGLSPTGVVDDDSLRPVVSRLFGFKALRAGQAEAISRAAAGNDLLILLPAGHGKSMVFQTAAFLLPGATLVIEAWRALLDDQVRTLEDHGISRVLAIHADRQLAAGIRLESKNLIYVAPERLYVSSFSEPFSELLRLRGLDLLVVDEAHVVSEAGHSFRPSYLGLVGRVSHYCAGVGAARPRVLALTATASGPIVRDVAGLLGIHEEPITAASLESDDGHRQTFWNPRHREKIIVIDATTDTEVYRKALDSAVDWLRAGKGQAPKGIAFCSSRGDWTGGKRGGVVWRGVRATADHLKKTLKVGIYMGGATMTAQQRAEAVKEFRVGPTEVMVATNAFGTGIDLPEIGWTLHLGAPAGLEAYYQECRRAGRKPGDSAASVLILDLDSQGILEALERARGNLGFFQNAREVLANGRDFGGSFARQLMLMIGVGKLVDSGADIRPDVATPNLFLPALPGVEVERQIDTYVLGCVFKENTQGYQRIEVPFHPEWDQLVWKSVHRLTELGVVRDGYRRDFLKQGVNRFYLEAEGPEVGGEINRLIERLEVILLRLRGSLSVTQTIIATTRDRLAQLREPTKRILFAAAVIIKSTYEVVRETRMESLATLRRYGLLEDEGNRRTLLEDFLAKDEYYDRAIEILEKTPQTAEGWFEALRDLSGEAGLREGTLRRISEDVPSHGLLDFLILVCATRSADQLEIRSRATALARHFTGLDPLLGQVVGYLRRTVPPPGLEAIDQVIAAVVAERGPSSAQLAVNGVGG